MSGTGHLDLDSAGRARLLASATAYAAGRQSAENNRKGIVH